MAIVVEEEKSRANPGRLFGWLGVIVILAVAVYYILFAAPELVVIPPPAGFATIAPISSASLHPEDVLNSPTFRALSQPSFSLPTSTGPAGVGRPNPFLPF